MIDIVISNKKYQVKEAKTEEERKKGLLGVEELPENEGMLFYFDPPLEVSMWMKNTPLSLDIIFINDELEVTCVYKGKPNSEDSMTCKNIAYVLEVNLNSGIEIGDSLDFEDGPVMKVLALDGSELASLWGGERIFSRKNTRILIKKAKKALESKSDSDYKALGKYIFKCIKILNERPAEYVEAPTKSE